MHGAIDGHCLALQNSDAYRQFVDYVHSHVQAIDKSRDSANSFATSKVRLEKKLEDFEIVPFDEDVSSSLKVDRFFRSRDEGSRAWHLQETNCIVLTSPAKVKASGTGFGSSSKSYLQLVEIDLAFNKDLWEQFAKPSDLGF